MWSPSSTLLFLKVGISPSAKRSLQACIFSCSPSFGLVINRGTSSLCSSSPSTSSLYFPMLQFSTRESASGVLDFLSPLSSQNSLRACSGSMLFSPAASGFLFSPPLTFSHRFLRRRVSCSSSSFLRSFSSFARTDMLMNSLLLSSSSPTASSGCYASVMRQTCRYMGTQEGKTDEKRKTEDENKQETKNTEKENEEKSEEKQTAEDQKQEPQEPRVGFFAKVRRDIKDYPDIYNKVNGMHFLLFLVFCLVSTASPTENSFWKNQLSISDKFRPLAWWVHSIITDNFLAMTYSMMMMHKLVVQMIPVWGLKRLQTFVLLTAGISGALMWFGNYMYYQWYKRGKADHLPEYQYGPWDVVYGLLIAQYLHVGIHPIRCILSFDNWLKYASGVGTICIWYFDWQPTFLGVLIGTVLCKAVPAFKVMPVKVA